MTTTFENAMIEAFPAVNAGIQPFGSRVLIQIRTPKKVSRGGIILDTGTQDTEKWNTQVGKVISLGPLAFKNRNDMSPWPEGDWCTVGEFVRLNSEYFDSPAARSAWATLISTGLLAKV